MCVYLCACLSPLDILLSHKSQSHMQNKNCLFCKCDCDSCDKRVSSGLRDVFMNVTCV